MAATVSFIAATTDTSDAATHTYSSQSLGAAADDRIIIVTVGWRHTGSPTISSLTVAGVPAVIVRELKPNVSTNPSAIAVALVPTGTSGDIVVNWDNTVLRSRISVYRAVGSSLLPTYASADGSDDPTASVNVPAGGFAVAAAATNNSTATTSWTGLTEDADANVESVITVSSASENFASEQTSLTVTADFSTASDSSGVFAAWGPSVTPSASGSVLLGANKRGGFQ